MRRVGFWDENGNHQKDYYLKTGEKIWLKKGTIGGNWQPRDFPIKNILILRETITVLVEGMFKSKT